VYFLHIVGYRGYNSRDDCVQVLATCILQKLVELDDIGFTIEAGTIYGYVQWWTGWLRSILDWTRSIGDLWLTDLYVPSLLSSSHCGSTYVAHCCVLYRLVKLPCLPDSRRDLTQHLTTSRPGLCRLPALRLIYRSHILARSA
jgi:hypothetical protein